MQLVGARRFYARGALDRREMVDLNVHGYRREDTVCV